MPNAETPAVIAARRASAKTGLIASVVILLLALILNVWVLLNDAQHHRAITLPVVGFVVVAMGLLLTASRWKRRMKRYPKPDVTLLDG